MSTSWSNIYDAAKTAGAKYPECVSAQWALESGFGAHTSGKNNYFGIKGSPGTSVKTQEWVNGKFVTVTATFKDYASAEESVKDLVEKWYLDYQGFQGVNRAGSRDECAKLLQIEGYATDPEYPEKLIKLMGEHQQEELPSVTTPSNYLQGYLKKAAQYYNAEAHQAAAWDALQAAIDIKLIEQFQRAYRNKPAQPVSPKPKFPLEVPYYYQRDSHTGQGERMCFSSSMAMAIEYLNPAALAGDDDDYLKVVQRYGDTVSSDAQLKAARSLGMTVTFHTNGKQSDLLAQLDKGIPVPIGILHKGSINNPTGGGHWITLIGYNSTHFMVHDPFGELDLLNGGYPKAGPNDGKDQRYSRKNLMARWLIASDSDGWYMKFNKDVA